MDFIQRCVLNLGVKKAILSLSQTPETFQSLKDVLGFDSLTGSALQKSEGCEDVEHSDVTWRLPVAVPLLIRR